MNLPITPIEEYQRRLDEGSMRPNPTQDAAVEALSQLFDQLMLSEKKTEGGFFGLFKSSSKVAHKGIYLHGPVGRGKTTIMDLFFDVLPIEEKRRTHFHEFMLDIHAKIHELQARNYSDPIHKIASDLARNIRVLCFDEFVVNNIADAMILGRLYKALLSHGVTMVATSNFEPHELYKNGLQRDRFVPFIELLEENTTSLYVNHEEDYRRLGVKATELAKTYYSPLGWASENKLKQHFETLSEGQEAERVKLKIGSRVLEIPEAVDDAVAWLDFETFLDKALGPADFLAIARRFPAVIIADIPLFKPQHRNQARRFITLVDALYNLNRRLVISAEAEPDALYPDGDGAFEFKRTASRLEEMRSEAYLANC